MDMTSFMKPVLAALQDRDIPVCFVGEIAMNYYNAPRVVHDLELCVSEASLSEAESVLSAAAGFQRVEVDDWDIFTEYKKGFPTLQAPDTDLRVVLFPDSHFYLSPLRDSILTQEEKLSTPCSQQILDLVPLDEIPHLPVPRLPDLFLGLCRRFFEANDYMARINVEQLVDGMDLNDDWIQKHLDNAAANVKQLAAQLVAEKPSRYDESFDLELGVAGTENLGLVPGSGYTL